LSNKPKQSSRKEAEIMVRDYHTNIKMLNDSQSDALFGSPNRPEIPISGKGRTSDDTARRGMMLSATQRRRKQEEVLAVQYAVGCCNAEGKQGEKIRTIIDLVYWKGTHTMYGAACAVGITSSEWAGKLAGRFFRWVTQWFEDDN
jgi:hypothetical protein